MNRIAIRITVFIAFVLVGFGAWYYRKTHPDITPASISIGMESTAVNSLVYITENRKFFAANGLNVIIKDNYPSGAAAAEGMLKGEVDIATAAELSVVRHALANQPIRAFGSIDILMHMKLICRKDRGIMQVADLAGKKIGLPVRSAADFEMDRFLELNGMKKKQVSIADIQAPRALDAVVNGEVDAVVAWQPNVMKLEDLLGKNASVWPVQNGQPIYCVLVTTDGWASEHPQLMKRFLLALRQAEDYTFRHDGEAKAIVQQRFHYDDRYIATIWSEHRFILSLDQALILAMEDQARWMIDNGLTSEKQVPDFLHYVSMDGLESVKPEAVDIIH